MKLIPDFDVAPFLSRPAVPYVAPQAPDVRGLMGAISDIGDTFMLNKARKQKQEHEQAQLAQQERLQSAQLATQRYGYDLQEQGRKETNARMERQDAERQVNRLAMAYADAQASGDFARMNAIQQELQRAGGWSLTEHPSNYTPPAAEAAPSVNTPAPQQQGEQPYDLESGGNPRAINPTTKASGIYQLSKDQLPPGMTPESFAALSADQQRADHAGRYLPSHGLSPADVQDRGSNYVAIAGPDKKTEAGGNVRGADSDVVYPRGSAGARSNPLWDINGDGQVTRGELADLGRTGAGGSVYAGNEPAMQPTPKSVPSRGSLELGPIEMLGPSSGSAQPSPTQGIDSVPLPKRAGAETETPQPGGGRFVFRDKSGKVVYEYDRPAIQAEQQRAVDAGLRPLFETARTPEEKQAAEAARGFAKGLVGQGFTVREVTQEALRQYRSSIGEAGKTERSEIGVRGQEKRLDSVEARTLQKDADAAIRDTSKEYGLPAMNTAELDVRQGLAALDANHGTGDTVALRRMIKSMERGATTDRDYSSAANSSGYLNALFNLPDKFFEGTMPPELKKNIRDLLERSQQEIARRRSEAADRAVRRIQEGSRYAPQTERDAYAERARNVFLGAPAGAGPSDEDLEGAFR
jgi:hypothetical protein